MFVVDVVVVPPEKKKTARKLKKKQKKNRKHLVVFSTDAHAYVCDREQGTLHFCCKHALHFGVLVHIPHGAGALFDIVLSARIEAVRIVNYYRLVRGRARTKGVVDRGSDQSA